MHFWGVSLELPTRPSVTKAFSDADLKDEFELLEILDPPVQLACWAINNGGPRIVPYRVRLRVVRIQYIYIYMYIYICICIFVYIPNFREHRLQVLQVIGFIFLGAIAHMDDSIFGLCLNPKPAPPNYPKP